MATARAKMGLNLLLALGLTSGAGALAYPLRSAQQIEQKQTTAAKTQDRKSEKPQPTSGTAAPTDLYGDPLPTGAIARLGTVRFRHGGTLEGIFFSPDGRTLISVGVGAVRMWDVRSGRQQRQIDLIHPYNRIFGPDLSPDGKLLAVCFFTAKVRFWDLASGAEVHPFGDDAPNVHRAAFAPSGEVLATYSAARGGVIGIWDIRKGKKIRSIEGAEGNIGWVRSLAFSPRGNILAFPRAGGVCVWDYTSGKVLHQLESSTKAPLECLAFSADGKLLAAASDTHPRRQSKDHAIHLGDLATGKEVAALQGHEDRVMALAMSPKGSLLASASTGEDQTIRFWDLDKRQEIGRSSVPARPFMALAFSADGKMLASAEFGGVLRLWDAQKLKEIPIPAVESNSVSWVRFAPDGQTLIVTANEQIGLWEPFTGKPRRIFNKDLSGYNPALSPNGKLLAAGSVRKKGQEAMLWDVASGKLVQKLKADGEARVGSFTFSADGRRVVGTSPEQGVIHTWDVSTGKELRQLKVRNLSSPLAVAPDGATLASSALERFDSTVRLWNLASGEEMWRKEMPAWRAHELKFAPDGRTLALAGGSLDRANVAGNVRFWDAATGKELKRFEGHRDHVFCVAFSADGRMMATGSRDKTIRLWEIASGRERRCLQGHKALIMAISFSPDGRLLASASFDATGLVWDLTGRFRDGGFHLRRLSAEDLERCWNDLAHADSARAYQSILALTGSPKEAIALLKAHLPPVTAAEPKRVAPLLASLDSTQFVERDKAMSELEKLALAVEPALREALNAKPSLEVRRRIEAVLEKLAGGPRLRFLRALEVLEHIATAEARQLLESLSQGTAEMWPAQEAKASLTRLGARAGVQP